ncbi:Mg-transporting ATPase [Mycena galericulata]|nr:Mg-transporting ATPase [Mycena galericulata]
MSPIELFSSARPVQEKTNYNISHTPPSVPSKFSAWLPSAAAKESSRREARDRRERAIADKLARYALVPATDIFTKLNPEWNPSGLTEEQAQQARQTHGLNTTAEEQPLQPLVLLFNAFLNPFNVLLLILGAISIGTGDIPTFGVMIAMVVSSTGLRFWQEMRSLSKAHVLVNSVSSRVHVLRPSEGEIEFDRKQIVPGDVLSVTSGDVFPGDCVLLTASSLTVSQASLTGEIMPIEKFVRLSAPQGPHVFSILDCENICLAGTSVTTGNGTALVLSTARMTYMASIAKELAMRRPVNAMQLGVRRVSFILLVFMLVMSPIVLVIQGLVHKDWKAALLFAVAVAVGIVPEMLPTIVASNLALSAIRVARKKAIVKRLDAVQNLGAACILCSDKTGTLTVDAVHVSLTTAYDGSHSDLPAKLAYLNAAMQTGTRSPIDSAIVQYAANAAAAVDLGVWTKLGEIPFDSTRRLLSVLVMCPAHEQALFITKGAVEEVLDSCTRVYSAARHAETAALMDDEFIAQLTHAADTVTTDVRKRILDTAERLNEDGLRLVAVACKLVNTKHSGAAVRLVPEEDEEELVFVGLLCFLDPLKVDARDAVDRLRKLNVQVRILTGDSAAVAAKVGRDLGLLAPRTNTLPAESSSSEIKAEGVQDVIIDMEPPPTEEELIVTGPQLSTLVATGDVAGVRAVVQRGIIFARLSPYQKLEVVEILRQGGDKAVAFLGDGVNDALAIRGADVGISVDSGTEIAKEAADVILLEKDLGVVADAIVEGRITFLNTIKYVKMAASSNFGNVFSILAASAWLPYQPMQPLQILVQNLLYDFSQGSIPWDNVDVEFLDTPKVWNSKSIITFMLVMGPLSSPFDLLTFCINWFFYGIKTADSPLVPRAQAHWFIEGSITQLFIVHFLRTSKLPFIQSRASTIVTVVTTTVACVAMALPWIPGVDNALQFERPEPEFYGFLVALVVAYATLVHLGKMVYLRLFKQWL